MNTKTIIVNKKSYRLSLDYIFGLWQGDGSITIQLKPNSTHKTGKQIVLIFEIHQHVIDVDLLKAISIYLGCGKVEIGRKLGASDTWVYRYRISTQSDILNILLPILQTQPMLLKKRHHDLILFIESCLLVKEKKHITIEGQKDIAKISSKLSSKLNLEKILAEPNTKLNADQITGFIDAEGCFSFKLKFDHKKSIYTSSSFAFYIYQESSEIKFLKDLISFFDCGIANIKKNKTTRCILCCD